MADLSMEECCPKCSSADGWRRTGRIDLADLIIAEIGGPKAPVEMSLKGGHCLACDCEEEAVYPEPTGEK